MKNTHLHAYKSLILPLFLILVSGCASTGTQMGTGKGLLYTELKEGELVTANQTGKKRGTACAKNIMGLVSTGDASIAAAMKDGAITIVSSIDHSVESYFVFYGKYCTIVTGM